MASEIILNDGDDISESDIRTLLGRESMSGYVAQGGLDITYHEGDDTVDVSDGTVYILDNLQDITVHCDAFVGHSLVAGAINHLWIAVDPTAATDDEAVSLVSNSTGVAPSNPHIKIAEVDTNKSGSAAATPANRGTAPALDGEDINPKSIGEMVPVASLAAENAAIDHLETNRSNRVWHLDAETSDFGAAIDAITDTMTRGDHLHIPPAEYTSSTTPVVNTPYITIEGRSSGAGFNVDSLPLIRQQTDGPALILDGVNATVRGLNAIGPDSGSASGIVARSTRARIENTLVREFGGHGFHIEQRKNRSVNNGVISDCAAQFNGGDGVRISREDQSAANANALSIHLTNAHGNGGWGINAADWAMGNEYEILNMTGRKASNGGSAGGIHHTGIDSYARLVYWEGRSSTDTGIQFEQAGNVGEIHHTQTDYPYNRLYTDNAPGNNFKWQYAQPGQPTFVGDEFQANGPIGATKITRPIQIDALNDIKTVSGNQNPIINIPVSMADGDHWQMRLGVYGSTNSSAAFGEWVIQKQGAADDVSSVNIHQHTTGSGYLGVPRVGVDTPNGRVEVIHDGADVSGSGTAHWSVRAEFTGDGGFSFAQP